MNLAINIKKLVYIPKISIIFGIFFGGILLAYYGSMLPWFIWPLQKVYIIISSFLIGTAMVLDNLSRSMVFSRKNWIVPASLAIMLLILQRIVNKGNVIGFTEALLNGFVIFGLLKLELPYLKKTISMLCKIMGGFLVISMIAFFLHLFGFPLPSIDISKEDLLYDFTNYFWFMTSEQQNLLLFPRFQSVFLEPGHLGTATSLLLFTQIGSWKKWYNISLLVATLLTFSLAAYVLLIMIIFVGAWMQGKKLFKKIAIAISVLAITTIVSLTYQDGDNLVNNLILSRMEVDEDGKLSGDNRVTDSFEDVYDDYVTSSDIWFGRDYSIEEFGFGNSGYRVFLYDYGLICLLLALGFYATMSYNPSQKRSWIAMIIVSIAGFWVRATPMTFYFLIPLYAVPFMDIKMIGQEVDSTDNETTNRKQDDNSQ